MKKINLLLSTLALASVVMFFSCSKKDKNSTPEPGKSECSVNKTYSLSTGYFEENAIADEIPVKKNETCVKTKFKVESGRSILKFKVLLKRNNHLQIPISMPGYNYNVSTSLHDVGSENIIDPITFEFLFDLPADNILSGISDNYTIIFYTNNSGTEVCGTANITLKYTNDPLPLSEVFVKSLTGGVLNSFNGQLLVSSTGKNGDDDEMSSVSGSIDISYQIGEQNGGEFVSPNLHNNIWLDGLTTTYFGTTDLDPETATAAELNSAAAPTGTSVTVTDGGQYIFKNAAGKKGLIKVNDFIYGYSGEVTFKYVVQQ